MKRRVLRFLGVAAIVAGVMAPTAALAQTDYPTPRNTPSVSAEPTQVGGAQAQRGASSSGASSGGALAFTGGEVVALSLVGVGLTGAGVVLVGLGRRRRSQIHA